MQVCLCSRQLLTACWAVLPCHRATVSCAVCSASPFVSRGPSSFDRSLPALRRCEEHRRLVQFYADGRFPGGLFGLVALRLFFLARRSHLLSTQVYAVRFRRAGSLVITPTLRRPRPKKVASSFSFLHLSNRVSEEVLFFLLRADNALAVFRGGESPRLLAAGVCSLQHVLPLVTCVRVNCVK